jgi:hypothetical protein
MGQIGNTMEQEKRINGADLSGQFLVSNIDKKHSLLNISVYRLQPILFMDSPPYLKKRTIRSYGSAARLDQAIVI